MSVISCHPPPPLSQKFTCYPPLPKAVSLYCAAPPPDNYCTVPNYTSTFFFYSQEKKTLSTYHPKYPKYANARCKIKERERKLLDKNCIGKN